MNNNNPQYILTVWGAWPVAFSNCAPGLARGAFSGPVTGAVRLLPARDAHFALGGVNPGLCWWWVESNGCFSLVVPSAAPVVAPVVPVWISVAVIILGVWLGRKFR